MATSVQIHRARECELSTLWTADASTADSLAELQQQQLKWEALDDCVGSSSCWQADAVSIPNHAIELHADASKGSKLQLTAAVTGEDTLHRLSLRMQLPKNGGQVEASVSVRLPKRGVTMVLSSAGVQAASNEVFLGSSQNTSIVVELPCVADVADAFHDVDFVWGEKWLRWYVDDLLVLEEAVSGQREGGEKSDRDLVLELSVRSVSLDAKLAVERIALSAGNSSDPLCGPHYSSSSNCRTKTPFVPRLGSIRGSLSTNEVDAYIDEVAAKFPAITKVEDFGKSVEGRPLRALCLGACYADVDQKVPQALFTGMHHAREPISMMNLVYTIDILTTDYLNGDLAALELLSSRQLWFMLVVNPDGYAHNEMQRVWEHNKVGQRKSALPNCNKSPADAGVDLNRNYDVCFARDSKGSSNKPCGDDYAGPSAFSEPETQAVRDLVERNTSDFSVALNYHSYGKYFNLPFACQAEGEPSEPSNSTFRALARGMAHFNGFNYGQSWKDSNLYTVNGETSDWMWQAHGIFAMSPEVGPGFELPPAQGFWPPSEDVPQLSADLHYSNLYITRKAGPMYSLDVNSVQQGKIEDPTSAFVSVQVSASNSGLRSASVELLGSMHLNGTHSSDPIQLELAAEPGSTGSELTEKGAAKHTVLIPMNEELSKQHPRGTQPLYLVLRDRFSCQLFRVAVNFGVDIENATQTSFQTSVPLPLPRCGTCELFGAALNSAKKPSEMPMCSQVKDVVLLQSVRTRHIAAAVVAVGSDVPNSRSSSSDATDSTTSSSSTNTNTNNPTSSTSITNTSVNISFSASASADGTSTQRASISSSILPSSVSWTGPVAMASIAGVVLLVIAVLVFRRRRRSKKKPGRVKAGSGVQKRRTNVQYSRVNEDSTKSPVAGVEQANFDDDDDEVDLLDAEFGRRRLSVDDNDAVLSTGRALSPPRRTSKQSRSNSEDLV